MILIQPHKLVLAVVRNFAHRLAGGPLRGGHRISTLAHEAKLKHARDIFSSLMGHLHTVDGAVGMEIGPGDNLDVCRMFVNAGAKMIAVEKYGNGLQDEPGITVTR